MEAPKAIGDRAGPPARGVLEGAIVCAAAVAVALPLAFCRYPPMHDLPCHEEIVAAMRYFWDRTRYPPGLLAWNLGYPNQLFYLLAASLSLLVPVAIACKLVVAFSVAAVPLAGARLADHLQVSRWSAIATAPLGLGFFFYFGFVGNLLGLSLLLASLPLLDTFTRRPTGRGFGAATLTLFLLYEAHESVLLIGCLSIVVLALGRPLRMRETILRMSPVALAACGMLLAQARAMHRMSANLGALPRVFDLALWQKRDGFPQALLGLHGSSTTLLPFYVVTSAVGLQAVHGSWRRAYRSAPEGIRGRLDHYRFELLGALLVALYFAFPFSIVGAMWLHARFLLPGVAILAIALAPRLPARPSLPARLAAIAAVGAMISLIRPELAATGALYGDLEPLLSEIAPASAVASLDPVGGQIRGLVFSVGGAAARASAERGGRMGATFIHASPIAPIVIAREHRWEDSFARMDADSLSFLPAFDLRRFRYVLAWTLAGQADALTAALAPEARLVDHSGGRLLYESTLPLESILSTEPASSGGDSVRDCLEARRGAAGR